MPVIHPDILGRILMLQSALHAAPDEKRLGELVCYALLDIPGIDSAAIYLNDLLLSDYSSHRPEESDHHWPNSCTEFQQLKTSDTESFVSLPFYPDKSTSSCLVIHTSDRGELLVYLPYVENTVNLITLMLEKQARENELQTLNQELEEAVKARVKDLHDREQTLKLLLDSTAEAFYGLDVDGVCTFANKACIQQLGYQDVDQLLGKVMHNIIHSRRSDGSDNPLEECAVMQTIRSGCGANCDNEVFWRVDGTSFPVEYWAYPMFQEDQIVGAVVTFLDITKRKEAEETIRKQQYYMKKAQELGQLGSWELDTQSNVLSLTDENSRIFGIPPGTVLTYESFLSVVHQDDRVYVDNEWRAAQEGKPFDIEHRLLIDGEVKWVREKADLEFDAAGLVVKAIGFTQDITAQKRSEEARERLEANLRQSYKMEAVGTLAGGIAHDFNNILSIILGNAEIVKEKLSADSEIIDNIDNLLDAASRARDLVKQILSYSRQEMNPRVPVDLTIVIEDSLRLMRATVPSSIKIQQSISKDCEGVSTSADSIQLQQVLMNLCSNSVHAMAGKGSLNIHLELVEVSPLSETPDHNLPAGKYLCLSVQDSGTGISQDVIERVFDPFFTTKQVGEGTGMGLAVVHGIVDAHNGAITVESPPGGGTLFKVLLPVAEDLGVLSEAEADSRHVRGNERILFVDDEECLAYTCAELLELQGYRVTSKTSSEEALAIFNSQPDGFDLVITDQTMPGMTGMELASELLKIRPDIPIVLCSGYSNDLSEQLIKDVGIREFCLKPLDSNQLCLVARKVLLEQSS